MNQKSNSKAHESYFKLLNYLKQIGIKCKIDTISYKPKTLRSAAALEAPPFSGPGQ